MSAVSLILVTGPLLMGSLLSFFLHGAYTMQLYHYYMNYAATDRRAFVYLVCVATAIELLHMCFSTHITYTLLAIGFGNPGSLAHSPVSSYAIPALNGAAGFCTQMFFAWRILALTRSRWGKAAAGLIALTAGLQLCASLAASGHFALIFQKPDLMDSLFATVTVWLAGSFFCDVLITATMVLVLLRTREETVYSSSKSLLSTLIYHTVENGMITTLCALADIICFTVYTDTWLHVALGYIIGRLYAIVLLATLNGRQRMRESKKSGEHGLSIRSGDGDATRQLQFSVFRSSATTDPTSTKTPTSVSITTEVQVEHDQSMRKSQIYP